MGRVKENKDGEIFRRIEKKGSDEVNFSGSQNDHGSESEKGLSFKIYDDINENFSQLENYFETKSDCSLDSLNEDDAFDYDPLTGEIKITRKDVEVFKTRISDVELENQNESNNEMFYDDITEKKVEGNKNTDDSLLRDVVSFFALFLGICLVYYFLQSKYCQLFHFI